MIIDSHCHLHDEKFKDDLSEVLQRAKDAGVTHFITIGCDVDTTKNAMNIAQKHENIYFSAGFHPHDAKHLNDESFATLKKLAQDKKCVAIGECGLDYYYNHSSKDEQQSAFIKQIKLAQELSLPIIIHLRDAYEDCLSILKSHLKKDDKVVIHCFSGTIEHAKILSSMGIYLSIPGIITFKKPGDLPQVVKEIPTKMLLIETDAPYLSPDPFRGKRNEPSFITYTLKAMAAQKNEAEETLAKIIYKNTADFFGLRI